MIETFLELFSHADEYTDEQFGLN